VDLNSPELNGVFVHSNMLDPMPAIKPQDLTKLSP